MAGFEGVPKIDTLLRVCMLGCSIYNIDVRFILSKLPKKSVAFVVSDVLNISILRGHHLGNDEFHHLSARDQWVP